MENVSGGRNVFGHPIGILVLESKFPRIPGDIGNATTWQFPVLYRVVKNATPDGVVRKKDMDLLPLFIEGAKELEKKGVRAITTSCGFLVMFQKEMASAVNVPVFTSSLMQVPLVYSMLKPSQKVGIITIYSKSLTHDLLSSLGIDRIPHTVCGTEGEKEFSRVILNDETDLNVEKSKEELVSVSRRMISEHPDVGGIVLECTNMTPYGAAVQEAVRLPVFDIYTLVQFVYLAVVRKGFSGYM